MRNTFHVGATGKKVAIRNISREPELTPAEALELGAWLVATAIPLQAGDAATNLQKFLQKLEDVAGDGDLGEAVRAELE